MLLVTGNFVAPPPSTFFFLIDVSVVDDEMSVVSLVVSLVVYDVINDWGFLLLP